MITWSESANHNDQVLIKPFFIEHNNRKVPGVIYCPTDLPKNRPLVLIGHGGSQDKTHPNIKETASLWVKKDQFYVAVIDGPIHGQRRDDNLSGVELQTAFRQMWISDNKIDSMVEDWIAVINGLIAEFKFIDENRIGWYGISMGTAYGIPLIANEKKIIAAVLGMLGTDFINSQRITDDSPKVFCPVLFQQKWDDQFFSRNGQLDLFEKIGSVEKYLKIYPGEHSPVVGQQQLDIVEFLSKKLS
jgi:predicted peptidase